MAPRRLGIDSFAISTIKLNSLCLTYRSINVFNALPAQLIGTYACIDSFLSFSLFLFLKHANAKNKSPTKTGTTPKRNPGWFSPISNAEHFLPSSKRTNGHRKKCRSPFLNSWAWNLPLSVIFSWMLGGGVSRNGRMTWAAGALPQPPALVPKHDRRTESKLGTTQPLCI